jgi:Family of unknown function (DUF6221)
MEDLLDWLTAQLDEDERVARAAGYHQWRLGIMFGTVIAEGNGKTVCRDCYEYDAEHIARHDPDRVLHEVEAKRIMMAILVQLLVPVPIPPGAPAATARYEAIAEDAERKLSISLMKLLALPYSDRPGYQEAWRP